MVRAAAFASLALALALPAAAQAPTEVLERAAPGSVHHGRSGRLDVAAVKVADELRIDGRLDEAAWSRAAILTGFSQFSPVDGLPAEDSTEMLVLYTDHAIHFGIRAFEPHGVVNATLADRDRVAGDDHVILLLDTFNDRRSAFAFLVNPLGVPGDGTYADATGTDLNPDFLFDSRGRLTDYGYEIEVRIPFKSVRYQSADVQRWGLNVVRAVQHSGQEQAWTPLDRGHPSILGQSGTLDGLTDLRRGLVLDVNPVMTARAVGAPSSAAGTAWLESFMYPADLYSSFFIERRDDTGAVLDTVPYVGTHRLPNYGGMIALNTPSSGRSRRAARSLPATTSTSTSGHLRGSSSRHSSRTGARPTSCA